MQVSGGLFVQCIQQASVYTIGSGGCRPSVTASSPRGNVLGFEAQCAAKGSAAAQSSEVSLLTFSTRCRDTPTAALAAAGVANPAVLGYAPQLHTAEAAPSQQRQQQQEPQRKQQHPREEERQQLLLLQPEEKHQSLSATKGPPAHTAGEASQAVSQTEAAAAGTPPQAPFGAEEGAVQTATTEMPPPVRSGASQDAASDAAAAAEAAARAANGGGSAAAEGVHVAGTQAASEVEGLERLAPSLPPAATDKAKTAIGRRAGEAEAEPSAAFSTPQLRVCSHGCAKSPVRNSLGKEISECFPCEASTGHLSSHPAAVEAAMQAAQAASVAPAEEAEEEAEWFLLKSIKVFGGVQHILLQSRNGACPLLAIANALILKGKLQLPHRQQDKRQQQDDEAEELQRISSSELLQYLSEFLLLQHAECTQDPEALAFTINDAMDLLPSLLQGLDLNVHFSAIDAFEFTRAVSLFDAFGLRLLHGWRPLRDKAHRRKAEASAVVGASSAVEAACGAEAAPASLGNVPAETAATAAATAAAATAAAAAAAATTTTALLVGTNSSSNSSSNSSRRG
ncbi:ubiquitin carboxyl-terminal hydrolase MINDY-2, partial [Cyclospora cayetanensis]|uniref:Ubiquitin carboxyl-terminal hydrolase MINDY-2 n=1 Tax=Cyclospora cayetanensis TaxID=88456 RepID=A0A6P6S447_9EIME